jgi:uncharacterized protein YdeI (YjbR/CyaY-like superfamily)
MKILSEHLNLPMFKIPGNILYGYMKSITVFMRNEFREWLVNNHDRENKVAVIVYKKHTGKPSPSHRDLVEESICFGWIDTTIKRLDKYRYIRHFSRRNKNSRWSDNTLQYAKNMIERGKMTPAGLKFYKEGLERPTHDAGIPKNPDMPIELGNALKKDKRARENFDKLSPTIKRMCYRWILRGKREETKTKRIRIVVDKAKVGRNDFFGTQEKVNV